MESKGRIGVIIPQISSNIDTQFVDVIHRKAAEYGYDTVVISGVINYVDQHLENVYSKGQTNIYDLILYGGFDGFIFEANTFCSGKLRKTVLDLLVRSGSPCVTVNYEQRYFPYVSADETTLLYHSAMHLIKKHGCCKLYCIGGYKGHAPSEARIDGFRRAMNEAGLEYAEDHIFYGDYWRDVPRSIAADIAVGRLEKPDGIVCGSDIMAAELVDTLSRYGINVPGDIAVTGCDGNVISQTGRISVTTIAGQERINGSLAVTKLLSIMGEETSDEDIQPELVIGESCGCGDCGGICRSRSLSDIREYSGAILRQLEQRQTNSHGEMLRRMSESRNIYDVLGTFMGCCYMIPTGTGAELCLCEDWCRELNDPSVFRRGGFSDSMFLGIECGSGDCGEKMKKFPTKDIFPSLNKPHEPELIVLSSLHYKGQIFGYVGFRYEKAVSIVLDEFYMNWCDTVSSGLNTVQNRMYKEYVNKRIESLSEFAPVLGIYNRRGLINRLMNITAENSGEPVRMMLISYIKEERVHYSVPPVNSIVNALRLSDSAAVMAILEDDMVAVVLPGRDADITEQEFAERVAESVTNSYKSAVEIRKERIKAVSCCITQADILSVDSVISRMTDSLRGVMISQRSGVFSYRERFEALRNDMKKHPEKEWSVDSITRSMGLSKTHFHRMYKEFFGTSCKEDIIAIRLEKVKWLLKNTSLGIARISEQCGYANNSHFIRQFTSKVGMSPSAYRKEKQ